MSKRIRPVLEILQRAAISLLFSAAAATSTAAYALDWNLSSANTLIGSGTIKTETRPVTGFTGVSLAVSGVLEIHQGSTEGISIETDDNLLPLVETSVENGVLNIRLAKLSYTSHKMKFIVNAKTINSLEIAGSGDIHAETLKATALKVSIAGSGDMRIKSLDAGALNVSIAGSGDFTAGGRAASLRASIAGSGDIMAGNLDTKTVELSIAGSGDATVWARESLKASLVGSGDVTYYGDAQVMKTIKGSGSIKHLGASPF